MNKWINEDGIKVCCLRLRRFLLFIVSACTGTYDNRKLHFTTGLQPHLVLNLFSISDQFEVCVFLALFLYWKKECIHGVGKPWILKFKWD